jgi:hypothetical protein
MKSYLVYDCEIIKMIPGKGDRLPGYDYCDGWHDHANMGISVIGCYSSLSNEYLAIAPDAFVPPNNETFETFQGLAAQHDLVAGFNSKGFDDRLCAANGINIKTSYDLLEEIRLAAYGAKDYRSCPQGHSYALGWIGQANGFPKTGTGELAPKLWQQGHERQVIDYCLRDCEITVKLLELGILGQLKNPNTGKMLTLRSPFT